MASQTLTDTPTALASTDADIWYTLQNRGNRPMYVQEGNNAPSDSSGAFLVTAGTMTMVKRTGSIKVFVWQDPPATGGGYSTVVYDRGQ